MSSFPVYVYVDVDDTFVRSASSKRIPMLTAIQHIRNLKAQGAVLYCWSSGGADYARQSADEFGIADCFEAFLPKPNVLLDDMPMTAWPRLLAVHPASYAAQGLEDYRRQLV
jgi:hypothetical protein